MKKDWVKIQNKLTRGMILKCRVRIENQFDFKTKNAFLSGSSIKALFQYIIWHGSKHLNKHSIINMHIKFPL